MPKILPPLLTLTKNDLVREVYLFLQSRPIPAQRPVNAPPTGELARDVVETLLEISKEALDQDGKLLIQNFGAWEVKEKRERKGRNPKTGDSMMLRERRVVSFKPSIALRDDINGASTGESLAYQNEDDEYEECMHE